MEDVIIGATVVRKSAFALEKFLQNQKEIQTKYPPSRLVISTEVEFKEELGDYLRKYGVKGEIIEKPKVENVRWSTVFGREALRHYVLETNANYLLSVDADMTFDPSVIEILQREIEGHDIVLSGYKLRSKDSVAIVFALGCCLIRRELLDKIHFRCYELKNHRILFDDAVTLEMDLVKARAEIKKGLFLAISHYYSSTEAVTITPQKLTLFKKITTAPLMRYILLRLSTTLKKDIGGTLQRYMYGKWRSKFF